MKIPSNSIVATTAPSEQLPEEYMLALAHQAGSDPASTASPEPTAVQGRPYAVEVSSTSASVELYYNPVLLEKKQQTVALNQLLEFGYIPPISQTKR